MECQRDGWFAGSEGIGDEGDCPEIGLSRTLRAAKTGRSRANPWGRLRFLKAGRKEPQAEPDTRPACEFPAHIKGLPFQSAHKQHAKCGRARDWGDVDGSGMSRRAVAGWESLADLQHIDTSGPAAVGPRFDQLHNPPHPRSPASDDPAGHIASVLVAPSFWTLPTAGPDRAGTGDGPERMSSLMRGLRQRVGQQGSLSGAASVPVRRRAAARPTAAHLSLPRRGWGEEFCCLGLRRECRRA